MSIQMLLLAVKSCSSLATHLNIIRMRDYEILWSIEGPPAVCESETPGISADLHPRS